MKRNRKAEEMPLSDYWKPPLNSELEKGVGAPLACLATTFELDAGFFEAELLPRFLGLRFDNTENERMFIIEREEELAKVQVAVLVDISKYDRSQSTLQWDQLPIQVPGGVQHAKVTLLFWEKLVRVIIGSANLTRPGYRRNRELFAVLDFFDSPNSVPLKLLDDILVFLEALCAWSRGLREATGRVHSVIEMLRSQGWHKAPKDFQPRERPRVTFVGCHPSQGSISQQSVIKQLFGIWGQRRVSDFIAMTPWVGISEGDDPVLNYLQDLRMARGVRGCLVVPEAPMPEGETKRVVSLPENFGRCWKKMFGSNSRVLLVPSYVEGEDEKPRDFHAKAILIKGDSHQLLMMGSSNFTPHGMGVKVFNCEANLVFEDWVDAKREGKTLEERLGLPVSWGDSVSVDELKWKHDSSQIPEDMPTKYPIVPPFFSWASYSQTTGKICIGLDRSCSEPINWSISLAGLSTEHSVLLFSQATSPLENDILEYTLNEKSRGAHISALRVVWQEENDENQCEGFLPVGVKNKEEDILPPKELRSLSIDAIVECLLTGREPAEWVTRGELQHKRSVCTNTAIESLRAVDTSNYLLYRVKRFGRALASMSNRIVKTPLIERALHYRLFRDPFGPIRFAEILCSEGSTAEGEYNTPESAYRLYVLAEIALSLGFICQHLCQTSAENSGWVKEQFNKAWKRLKEITDEMKSKLSLLDDNILSYVEVSFDEFKRILDIQEDG